MARILATLLACAFVATPLLSQTQTGLHSKFFWDVIAGERGTLIRYGNWYGPGWWGGSEKPDRPGPLPPIDALDATAQKHDFGYQIAEDLGKGRPDLEAHYKALADAIAVRDAMNLSEDPTRWNPPAPDPAQARRYRERIAVGFSNYQQKLNELKAWIPHRADPTDPEELERMLNGVLDDKKLEALMVQRVRSWNRDYEKRQTDKQRERSTIPPGSSGQKSVNYKPKRPDADIIFTAIPLNLSALPKAQLESTIANLIAQHRELQGQLVALSPMQEVEANAIRAEQKDIYKDVMRLKAELAKRK